MVSPIRTDSAAVFKYAKVLEESYVSNFGDDFDLHKVVGDEIWLPRGNYEISEDRMEEGSRVEIANNFIPRNNDQRRVYNIASDYLHSGRSFILEAPTGWGKTVVGSALIASVGRRALVITTKEDILFQWRESLKNICLLSTGEVGDWRGNQTPKPQHKVVVGLVQSLMKGGDRYPIHLFKDFGFVIVDEVHRMGADEFSQAMWWLPAKLRLGMSATVDRKDGKDIVFKGHIGEVAVVAGQPALKFNVVVYKTDWRVPIVRRKDKAGPIPHSPGRIMSLMESMSRDMKRNEIIMAFVEKSLKTNRYVVVFSDTIAHLKILRMMLDKHGVKDIGWYVGSTSDVYQGTKKQRLKQREVDKKKRVVLATYKMVSEGTDVPWWDTLILGTPRKDVRQIIGRILREYIGKRPPLVLDLYDFRSRVLDIYFKGRLEWYREMNAKVKVIG